MADDPIKDALKMIPYGFYALTAHFAEDVNAMVVTWLTQVSFQPTKVAVGLQKSAYSHDLVSRSGVFCINIFREEDAGALKPFSKGRAKDPDKMKNAQFTPSELTGCPVLEGAAAYLEFEVDNFVDIGGDHDIVVGRVVGGKVMKRADPGEVLMVGDLGWSYAG